VNTANQHYDVLVIGSGFGGSVTALRLTEKGYRVGVLEAGARFDDEDLPEHGGEARKFIFRPELGMYGIQRIDIVHDCFILAGAGVGGGSLVYANTLYEPLEPFYRDPQWAHITDWKDELAPYYDQAKRMLGVTEYARTTPADEAMKQVAEEMGVGDTFHPTPVGVFFGSPGQPEGDDVADPYFGGVGPSRRTCLNCGSCMTGCRHNAKNTLVKNYLYLAEQNGAAVHPLTTVTDVRPRAGGGYEVTARWTKAKLSRRSAVKTFTADEVVFSAAALGTQKLLHRLKAEGSLPDVSDRLGVLTRTNSEAILWATANDDRVDWSEGVAITSSFHPDEHTHVEPVRYGPGRNVMPLMATVLVDEVLDEKRWRTWGKELWKQRSGLKDLYSLNTWSRRTVVALVMQTLDNSITTVWRTRGPVGYMSSVQGHGAPNPTYIAAAYDAVRRLARVMDAADRPLHRGLRDRRLARDRSRRPLPADVRAPGPARRGRLGGLGQPRREPVADDHGAGRARDGLLAQQGRGRPPPRPGSDLPAAGPGRAEESRRARGRPRSAPPADRRRELTKLLPGGA
jgi:cholesterol oxidase